MQKRAIAQLRKAMKTRDLSQNQFLLKRPFEKIILKTETKLRARTICKNYCCIFAIAIVSQRMRLYSLQRHTVKLVLKFEGKKKEKGKIRLLTLHLSE